MSYMIVFFTPMDLALTLTLQPIRNIPVEETPHVSHWGEMVEMVEQNHNTSNVHHWGTPP